MSRTPIWKSIAETLKRDIAAGQYHPGDKLPTEAALAARFDVNRHTVRRALADLAAAALVEARRGSGVYVSARPMDYPLGKRVRFNQNLRAAGRAPKRQTLLLETRACTAYEAEQIGLAQGDPIVVFEGLSFADDETHSLFQSLFPAEPLPNIEAALREDPSVTRALRLCGVQDYVRASTRVNAVPADPTQARHLNIREGAPLLRTISINKTPAGQLVEFGRTWFAGDRVTLTLSDTDQTG